METFLNSHLKLKVLSMSLLLVAAVALLVVVVLADTGLL
jgi:hypothetical protein